MKRIQFLYHYALSHNNCGYTETTAHHPWFFAAYIILLAHWEICTVIGGDRLNNLTRRKWLVGSFTKVKAGERLGPLKQSGIQMSYSRTFDMDNYAFDILKFR